MKLKYFKLKEFACPCCGQVKMDKEFLYALDDLRGRCKFPFKITSGYRCEKHNKEIGGVKDSAHVKGLAADIAVSSGSQRFDIVSNGLIVGFTRFGPAKHFIHVDMDTSKPQHVIWTYDHE